MLSERINKELTQVDGDLNDLNVRREKLIDGRSRAVVAEGGLSWLKNQVNVKNHDEKEAEFDFVLDDLTDRLFPDKKAKEKKVVDVTNEDKRERPTPPKSTERSEGEQPKRTSLPLKAGE